MADMDGKVVKIDVHYGFRSDIFKEFYRPEKETYYTTVFSDEGKTREWMNSFKAHCLERGVRVSIEIVDLPSGVGGYPTHEHFFFRKNFLSITADKQWLLHHMAKYISLPEWMWTLDQRYIKGDPS